MPREYTPVPLEYLEEMVDLTDAEFGELMRALLNYVINGVEVRCEGKGNMFRNRVMRKADYYAKAFAEEEERRKKRSEHAKIAADARNKKISSNLEHAQAGNNNTLHDSTVHDSTVHDMTEHDSKKSNKKNLRSSCSELCESSEPAEPPVIKIPLNDGTEFPVYQKDIALWQETYQAVDVYQQLKEIRSWSDANPAKRKTQKGVRRFINMWLAKEQDKGGSPQNAGGRKQGPGAKKAPVLTEFG